LINDQSSGVGVILEKSRLQSVLRGTANGEVVLERVMSDEQVPLGEPVLTSGGDQIFPKGLPVGSVAKVGNGKDLFLNIKVKPATNLSKLEEVLVLIEKQEREAVADDSTRVRASDILAARLPTVPDKPAETPASNAASGTKPAAVPAASQTTAVQKPAVQKTSQPKPDLPKQDLMKPDMPKPAGADVSGEETKPTQAAAKPATTPKPVKTNSPPPNPQPAADDGAPH